MSSKYTKARVIENIEIAKNIFKMTIEGDYSKDKAGQFYMLRAWGIEPFLSRPISIHDANESGIEFLYEVRGEGTRIFSELENGDYIELLGPVGNGFYIENISGKVAIVTGGIGIAPMYMTAKKLKEKGVEVDFYAGFRDEVYSLDYVKDYVKEVSICTDSGCVGHKGLVIDVFDPKKYDVVLSCGPTPMMERVAKMCDEVGTLSYVSLESHMACGVGACLGCTCDTKEGKKEYVKKAQFS
ncbi:dihydroorotate dehydrogenase electron transfer subunit PyrK [Gottschalkia acidurici 9a]|uniref:Dihydroorotate dehydrogenase electron transfer subunit PyrK n=1 Tax=Gottschalkia acidurici (strain ATCC 7906 / DSM 604 / BCRC 14475 / CIP 104303 / KCTC 5404 / NCIMB 10678 / 9a) TaxID=1128398 RepID=K0AX11_GOTA9|nr:dihydroorotate dehydrogenase electron transfer subunit [Gottschalkia acidurici]AFS77779.1 dihydroorotate dehydrogenase electron transfer subunit PyrK [Gottschalkia acidurici 9a]